MLCICEAKTEMVGVPLQICLDYMFVCYLLKCLKVPVLFIAPYFWRRVCEGVLLHRGAHRSERCCKNTSRCLQNRRLFCSYQWVYPPVTVAKLLHLHCNLTWAPDGAVHVYKLPLTL